MVILVEAVLLGYRIIQSEHMITAFFSHKLPTLLRCMKKVNRKSSRCRKFAHASFARSEDKDDDHHQLPTHIIDMSAAVAISYMEAF